MEHSVDQMSSEPITRSAAAPRTCAAIVEEERVIDISPPFDIFFWGLGRIGVRLTFRRDERREGRGARVAGDAAEVR